MMDKMEHNKRFIMNYLMLLNNDPSEATMRKYADNESYIKATLVYRKAFPDYVVFVEDITAEGNFVIIHGIFRGTHKGDLMGLPPTFKEVEFPAIVKYQIVNDKIINAWPMSDPISLLEQLGVLKKPN